MSDAAGVDGCNGSALGSIISSRQDSFIKRIVRPVFECRKNRISAPIAYTDRLGTIPVRNTDRARAA